MTRNKILEILKDAGVLQEGHFILTSGRHSNKYMQCAKVFQRTKYSEKLCKLLADKFSDASVDVVIGPAMGAITMAYEVSRNFGAKNIFTERENGAMVLRRGFSIEPGQNVLIVEDVITTGGSVKEVIEIVKNCGANIVGVGVLVDRSAGSADFGARLESVITVDIETFDPSDCPLCKQGTLAVKPGSRNIANK